MYDFDWGDPLTLFLFVGGLIVITGVFSVIRTNAKARIIRDAIQSGQPMDPELLKTLQDEDDNSRAGNVTGGLVLMGAAAGLAVLGYQLRSAEPNEPIFEIMLGVAAIPFLIGVALLLGALFAGRGRGE